VDVPVALGGEGFGEAVVEVGVVREDDVAADVEELFYVSLSVFGRKR
jgi:hypothetical protein